MRTESNEFFRQYHKQDNFIFQYNEVLLLKLLKQMSDYDIINDVDIYLYYGNRRQ